MEYFIEPDGMFSMLHLVDDVPFKTKISIRYRDGYLVKNAESSMFPKNWDINRIQEEVAFVYENAQKNRSSIKQVATNSSFGKIEGESMQGFKILIEVDSKGNIMNAYPKL